MSFEKGLARHSHGTLELLDPLKNVSLCQNKNKDWTFKRAFYFCTRNKEAQILETFLMRPIIGLQLKID